VPAGTRRGADYRQQLQPRLTSAQSDSNSRIRPCI
jgi:hypothetical protein